MQRNLNSFFYWSLKIAYYNSSATAIFIQYSLTTIKSLAGYKRNRSSNKHRPSIIPRILVTNTTDPRIHTLELHYTKYRGSKRMEHHSNIIPLNYSLTHFSREKFFWWKLRRRIEGRISPGMDLVTVRECVRRNIVVDSSLPRGGNERNVSNLMHSCI